MKDWIRKSGYIYLSLGILILAVLFAFIMVSLFWTEPKASHTTVGTIYLGDKSAQEYEIAILLGYNEWRSKANYDISYNKYTKKIPLDSLVLDLEATLSDISEGQQNSAKYKLTEQVYLDIKNDVMNYFGQTIFDAMDFERLFSDILNDVEKMSLQKEYSLYSYLDSSIFNTLLNVSTIKNISVNDINEITSAIEKINIPAKTRFSLLNAIGNSTLTNEQMSIIAAGMQSVIMPTGFSGIVRQQYLDPPLWGEIGKNVRILQVSKIDFSFFNPLDTDYVLKITRKGTNSLSFELYGLPFLAEYCVKSVTDDKIAFQTKYIEDLSIEPDMYNVDVVEYEFETVYRILEQEGQSGSITIFYRTVIHPDGTYETSSILQEFLIPRDQIYRQKTVDKEDN